MLKLYYDGSYNKISGSHFCTLDRHIMTVYISMSVDLNLKLITSLALDLMPSIY